MTDAADLRWRRAEFLLLYVGLPVLFALALPSVLLPAGFLGATALAFLMLARTPGFSWSELLEGWRGLDVRLIAGVALAVSLALGALVWLLLPGQALALPRFATGLWIAILLLYPWLSALPQEVMFRVLFFRRYGALFPDRRIAVGINGAVFGLAHLAYWNWVAVPLAALGGALFADAYLRRGGFPMASVLHSVCGMLVFTSGLGLFFYHGAIGR